MLKRRILRGDRDKSRNLGSSHPYHIVTAVETKTELPPSTPTRRLKRLVSPTSPATFFKRFSTPRRSNRSSSKEMQTASDKNLGIQASSYESPFASLLGELDPTFRCSTSVSPQDSDDEDIELLLTTAEDRSADGSQGRLGIQRPAYVHDAASRHVPSDVKVSNNTSVVHDMDEEAEITFERTPEKEEVPLFERAWSSDEDENEEIYAALFRDEEEKREVEDPMDTEAAATRIEQINSSITSTDPGSANISFRYTDDDHIVPHGSLFMDETVTSVAVTATSKATVPETPTRSPVKAFRDSIRKRVESFSPRRTLRSLSPARSRQSRSKLESSSPSTTKIFVLLLHPESKIFELIQLVYPSATTTVGDILTMLPHNATEPALSTQPYVGLTRPKKRSADYMAPNVWASRSQARPSMALCNGEVAVALPQGYTHNEIVRLAKKILANSKIQKLVERSQEESRPSSKKRTPAPAEDSPLEKAFVETTSQCSLQGGMQRGLKLASQATADDTVVDPCHLKSSSNTLSTASGSSHELDMLEHNLAKLRSSRRSDKDESCETNSLEGSLSSAHSFQAVKLPRRNSFASLATAPVSPVQRRRKKSSKLVSGATRLLPLVLVALVARWYTDPEHGYGSALPDFDRPMGLWGGLQFSLFIYLLVRFQLHFAEGAQAQRRSFS